MLGCPLLVFWLESGFDILGKKKYFPMFKGCKVGSGLKGK